MPIRPAGNLRNSIHQINTVLLLLFFIVDMGAVFVITRFVGDEWVNVCIGLDALVSLGIVALLIVINHRYDRDRNSIIESFRETLDTNGSTFRPKDHFFVENKKLSLLLKKAYVKNRLSQKDYGDLKWVFEKFIPQDIFREVGFRGYERVILGMSKTKTMSIMFLDIMGFADITEKISPDRILLLLNIYFDGIGEIVYRHGGYIDSFLGDGIMVIFDCPISDAAVACALEVQEYIRQFQVSAIGKKLNIGIGINTGEVIIGTVGTKMRMDATVIGETVNIASRLEELTRKYHHNILIGATTYESLEHPEVFAITDVGQENMKGRTGDMTIRCVTEKAEGSQESVIPT